MDGLLVKGIDLVEKAMAARERRLKRVLLILSNIISQSPTNSSSGGQGRASESEDAKFDNCSFCSVASVNYRIC